MPYNLLTQFRQRIDFTQKTSFLGRFLFLECLVKSTFLEIHFCFYTETLYSRSASLREVFLSVDAFRFPMIKAQGT